MQKSLGSIQQRIQMQMQPTMHAEEPMKSTSQAEEPGMQPTTYAEESRIQLM